MEVLSWPRSVGNLRTRYQRLNCRTVFFLFSMYDISLRIVHDVYGQICFGFWKHFHSHLLDCHKEIQDILVYLKNQVKLTFSFLIVLFFITGYPPYTLFLLHPLPPHSSHHPVVHAHESFSCFCFVLPLTVGWRGFRVEGVERN